MIENFLRPWKAHLNDAARRVVVKNLLRVLLQRIPFLSIIEIGYRALGKGGAERSECPPTYACSPSWLSGVCSDVACRVAVIIMPRRDKEFVVDTLNVPAAYTLPRGDKKDGQSHGAEYHPRRSPTIRRGRPKVACPFPSLPALFYSQPAPTILNKKRPTDRSLPTAQS